MDPKRVSRTHFDQTFKVLVVGNSMVGKSVLMYRFVDDTYDTSLTTTIGIDFKIKTIDLDGKRIKLQIWDTAGQERYKNLTQNYYRGAHGVMLVYDVTDKQSFEDVKTWIRSIDQNCDTSVQKILLGNKCDLEDQRVVSKESGQQLAINYGLKFLETSSKESINVEEAFTTIARDIKAFHDQRMSVLISDAQTITVDPSAQKLKRRSKKKCC